MLIIGESLNATNQSVRTAIIGRDEEKIASLAHLQVSRCAHMLDVNAVVSGRDEIADLVWMVKIVQSAVQVPLMIDSPNPAAIRAALEVYTGPKPILSSITGEAGNSDDLIRMAVKFDCGLVALCMDETGISSQPQERLAVAKKIVQRVTKAGVKPAHLYIDPLVMPVAPDYHAGNACMQTINLIRQHVPEVRIICGASNISHGSPKRALLNQTFVAMLMALGVDAFIADVRKQALLATLLAANTLAGHDEWCQEFIAAYRAGNLDDAD